MKINNKLLKEMSEYDKGSNTYMIEEMAELTQAFMKQQRDKKNANVLEEIADVYCTMMIYCYHHGISEATLVSIAEYKINRELGRIANDRSKA